MIPRNPERGWRDKTRNYVVICRPAPHESKTSIFETVSSFRSAFCYRRLRFSLLSLFLGECSNLFCFVVTHGTDVHEECTLDYIDVVRFLRPLRDINLHHAAKHVVYTNGLTFCAEEIQQFHAF